jgi:hypothetical protein
MRANLHSREVFDNGPHGSGEPAKDQVCWLLGQKEGGFVQQYLSGQKCIAVRRAEVRPGRNAVCDGFILQPAKISIKMPVKKRDMHDLDIWLKNQNPMMFPFNVEVMEGIAATSVSVPPYSSFSTSAAVSKCAAVSRMGKPVLPFGFLPCRRISSIHSMSSAVRAELMIAPAHPTKMGSMGVRK